MKERNNMPIALLFGGWGAERRISERGACRFIGLCERCGVSLLPIGITAHGDWYIYLGEHSRIGSGEWVSDKDHLVSAYPHRSSGEGGFLTELGFIRVQSVIPLLHGDGGEDGVIQGALDAAGIRFFGCSSATGAIAYDKAYTKIIAESVGIPCVPWVLFIDDEKRACDSYGNTVFTAKDAISLATSHTGYPLFVKPSRGGSSIGASIARNENELTAAIARAREIDSRILIEQAITEKCELECAYLSLGGKEIISRPAKISVSGGFYDYKAKYELPGIDVELDITDEALISLVRKYTARLCGVLSVKNISRIDYFLTCDGRILFNEINTFPGFTERSLYLSLIEREGVGIPFIIKALGGECEVPI